MIFKNLYLTLLILAVFVLSTFQASQQLHFSYNSFMIPHPEKAHRGGEDAYFNSSKLLVVADGVGGWNNQGIDPSKYSRFLCTASQQYLKQNPQKYISSPLEVITRAHSQNQNLGSSTMVVVSLDKNLIRYCYIGDSGFMVIRNYEKLVSIYEYVEQQHGFNFPFQLAMQTVGGDDPLQSICGLIEAKVGDIIVVGSDGLFDNISFHQIFQQVENAVKEDSLLSGLAQKLAQKAISRGEDKKFNSPFAQRAKQQKLKYMGGKLDDTTVIIAQIVSMAQEKIQQQLEL